MPILWVDAHHQTICNPMPLSCRASKVVRRFRVRLLVRRLSIGAVILGVFCICLWGIVEFGRAVHGFLKAWGL